MKLSGKNPLGIEDCLSNDIYKKKTLIPMMPWLEGGYQP
jgi:hypothetical protein